MGKRRARKDGQFTFVPEDEAQPLELKPQPSVKGELFEVDMARFFLMDWRSVKAGPKQWTYWWSQAEEVMAGIRATVGAFQGEVVTPEIEEEYGLPEAWQEYSEKLKPLYQAYPEYLRWFAQRVELEYHDLKQKWNAWWDAAFEDDIHEGFSPEFWALDHKVCAYEAFVAAVRRVVPGSAILEDGSDLPF